MEILSKKNKTVNWREYVNVLINNVEKTDNLHIHLELEGVGKILFDYRETKLNGVIHNSMNDFMSVFSDCIDLEKVESDKIILLNQNQFEELQKTDWYFTRKVELGIDVPIDIINQRLEIRNKYDALKLQL